jgi:hypothetical protein
MLPRKTRDPRGCGAPEMRVEGNDALSLLYTAYDAVCSNQCKYTGAHELPRCVIPGRVLRLLRLRTVGRRLCVPQA